MAPHAPDITKTSRGLSHTGDRAFKKEDRPGVGERFNDLALAHFPARKTTEEIKLRDYQQKAVDQVKRENTILNLPTGQGKTIVAVHALDHFLKVFPSKKIMFVVPTCALVIQQARYIRNHSMTARCVAELYGNTIDSWTLADWNETIETNEVFVGTPEIFRRALIDTRFLSIGCVSFIVYDECHHATKNHAMAHIQRYCVLPFCQDRSNVAPRVLGLTGSYVKGAFKNLAKARMDLEKQLGASMLCIELSTDTEKTWRQIIYPAESFEEWKGWVFEKMSRLVNEIETSLGITIADVDKLVKLAQHVLQECGIAGFRAFVREGVVAQLIQHADKQEQYASEKGKEIARKISKGLPQLRSLLKKAANESFANDLDATHVSAKCKRLIQLACQIFNQHKADNSFRGLVFVEQTVLTFPIAELMSFGFKEAWLQKGVGIVSGQCTQTAQSRNKAVSAFADGELHVLVTTSALEEGIDVPECAFVIRFSKFETVKSHIQADGRARRADAEYYYFENDPEDARAKANEMQRVAKDHTLAVDLTDMSQRMNQRSVSGRYPYGAEGTGLVTIHNCHTILLEYCSKTMRQSINLDVLCTYKDESVNAGLTSKSMDSVRFPSPAGWISVGLDEVVTFWRDVNVLSLSSNPSSIESERRRFIYTAVVRMREVGYLDDHNQPSDCALLGTRAAVEAIPQVEPQTHIRPRYPSSIVSDHSTTKLSHQQETAGYEQELAVSPASFSSTRRVPTPLSQPQSPASSPQTLHNFKGLLNEEALRRWRVQGCVIYNTLNAGEGGFFTTVTLPRLEGGKCFRGPIQRTKKQAEQSGAHEAYSYLCTARERYVE